VQHLQPVKRAPAPGAGLLSELEEELVDGRRHRGCSRLLSRGDGFYGPSLGHHSQQGLIGRRQSAAGGDRLHHHLDDPRVQYRAPGGHLADGANQLVAFPNPVLEQVGAASGPIGEQGHGVLGVVELRKDHDSGAGMAFLHLGGRGDALVAEIGGHPDIRDHDLGVGLVGAGHQLVVVPGDADHLDVVGHRQQRPNALAHDQVVVSQEYRDPPLGHGLYLALLGPGTARG
jgi:hypothetical protein